MNETTCVLGLGEVLWDCFPSGARFGGAPANFACHAAALGAEAYVVSRVGADDLGRRALAELQQRNVKTVAIQSDSQRPTGTVQVALDEAGVASYQFGSDDAWDHLQWDDILAELAGQADAICFGTLGQRHDSARTTIRQFLQSAGADCLRVLDLNLRQNYYSPQLIRESLELATVLKLNDDELQVVADVVGCPTEAEAALPRLAEQFGFRAVALTRGPAGAALYYQGSLVQDAGVPTDVVDTVGAGDSFTATLSVGILAGLSGEQIVRRACRIAAFVCTQTGATPALPEELADLSDA